MTMAGAAMDGERDAQAATRMPTHVACVGDSITAGVGASSSNNNYPSRLQTALGSSVQVRNFGHSGATLLSVGDTPYQNQAAYTNATTFVRNAGANAVVDVIIMLGTNDSKSYNWMAGGGTRAAQFKTDLAAMVDHFAELPARPLVYLALPARAYNNSFGISGSIIHDQIVPIIKEVAAAKAIPTIDVDGPTTNRSELFPDGVHPNDAGYALLAMVMHQGLQAGGSGAGGMGGSGMGGGAGMGASGGAGGAGGGRGGRGGAGGAAGVGGSATGGQAGMGGAAGSVGGSGGAVGTGGTGGPGGRGGATGSGGSGSGGSSGSGGASGATGGSSGSGTGGSVAGTGGSPAGSGGAPGSGGARGTGATSGGGDDDGGGCSVAASAERARSGWTWLSGLLLVAASALWRRRSRRTR